MKNPNAIVWEHFKELAIEKRIAPRLKKHTKKLNAETAGVLDGVFRCKTHSASLFVRSLYCSLDVPGTSFKAAFAKACAQTLQRPVVVLSVQPRNPRTPPGQHPSGKHSKRRRQAHPSGR